MRRNFMVCGPRKALLSVFYLGVLTVGQVQAQLVDSVPAELVSYPEMILYNGKVLTADDRFTIAEAVAIRDGKFLAVGTNERLLEMAGPETGRLDLKGRTVIPGFINSHHHLGRVTRDSVREWHEPNDVLEGIRKAAAQTPPGQWIAKYYSINSNIPGRLRKEQLDTVAPDHPVLVGSSTGSPLVLNTQALKQVQFPANIAGVQRDPKTGQPTGAFDGSAAAFLWTEVAAWVGSMEDKIVRLKRAIAELNALGVTTIHTHIDPDALTAVRELWAAGELTLRWRIAFTGFRGQEDESVFFKRIGNLTGIGDDLVRISGINATGADGLGGTSPTAGWRWKPKLRSLRRSLPHGDERLVENFRQLTGATIKLATKYGWSVVGQHSLGDRATSEVLKAYEEALEERIVRSKAQTLRADHLLVVRDEDIAKMKQLGVMTPSVAMWHLMVPIDSLVYSNGADEVTKMTQARAYIKAGLKPVGEIDRACPLWSIEKFVARKDNKGRVWAPQERVTREEALWMHTNWASYYIREQDRLGTIEPGKLADLVVLDGDYMKIPEDQLSDLKVVMTILGGKTVHDGGDSGTPCIDRFETEGMYETYGPERQLWQ